MFFFLFAADRSNFLEQPTRPHQTRQTIRRHQLRQTRLDQPSFLPQTTQPNQLPLTDHPARPFSSPRPPNQASFLSQSTQIDQHPLKFISQQHITTVRPASTGQDAIVNYVSQVRSFLCVLGHGSLIYKVLDEPYKAYFPHTLGLQSLDFLFRLYLIVIKVASGVSWAGEGLPYPFSIVGLLCRYLVSDRSSAFQKQFRLDWVSVHLFAIVGVIVLDAFSRLATPNQRPISLPHFTF